MVERCDGWYNRRYTRRPPLSWVARAARPKTDWPLSERFPAFRGGGPVVMISSDRSKFCPRVGKQIGCASDPAAMVSD